MCKHELCTIRVLQKYLFQKLKRILSLFKYSSKHFLNTSWFSNIMMSDSSSSSSCSSPNLESQNGWSNGGWMEGESGTGSDRISNWSRK